MLRVFLVGSPRSGTTLLQRLVAAHPALTSFPESHFFYALCGDSRYRKALRLARRGHVRERLLAFLEESSKEGEEERRHRVERCRALFYGPWIELFVELLDDLAHARGARGWIEKTPLHLHYLHLMERYVPSARILHIVRSGVPVVASVRRVTGAHPEAWGGERSVEACVERWLFDMARHRKYLGAPGHHFVRYRELVERPAEVLGEVCDFLDLPFSSAMLDEATGEGIVLPGEPWKEGARERVSAAGSRTVPEEVLDPDELAYVRRRVEAVDLSIFT